ncbi:unnamed protein product [Absidia cylindrospora]
MYEIRFLEPLLDQPRTRSTGILLTFGTTSLWCLCMCCYVQILRIPPGSPKKTGEYAPGKNNDRSPQLISVCQENGTPRFCKMCKSFKPERSHHCRVCNTCVLKMDHHCSWINGCVGYKNHKIFLLFLFYTMIYVVWLFYNSMCLVLGTVNIKPYSTSLKFIWTMYKVYFVTLGNIFWNMWQSARTRSWVPLLTGTPALNMSIKFQIIIMLYLTFLFGVFLFGLTVIQLYLILHNRTTLEHIATHEQYIQLSIANTNTSNINDDTKHSNSEVICLFPPEKRLYDIGLWNNWKSVMGDQWYLWFVPTPRPQLFNNDGYAFPYGDQAYRRILSDASATSRLQ